GMRVTVNVALEWFKDAKDGKEALVKHLSDGGTYERYFVVLNDPVREAIAVRLLSGALKGSVSVKTAAAPVEEKKAGLFGRLFGKK
ncbi:MAG: hypothetical protein PSW75_10295, partial [bacterium]|nr:hypothetical protein [bacterium]